MEEKKRKGIAIKKKTLNKIISILLLLLLFTTLVSAENLKLIYYEQKISLEYNGWDKPEYTTWDCSNMSPEIEKYFETKLGFTCYLAYGYRRNDTGAINSAHVWNIVIIDKKIYEFESTNLKFEEISKHWIVSCITTGVYLQGVRQNTQTTLNNWEDLI